jgi:outer membrane protein
MLGLTRYICPRSMSHFLPILLLISFSSCTLWGQNLTLDSCVAIAVRNNPGLTAIQYNTEIAELDQQTALGGFLPNLNGQASHGYNWGQRIDPFTNQFASSRIRSNNFGVAANLNLFNGFQQWNTLNRAETETHRNQWNYEKSKNDLALNVASAFLNVLLSKELLTVATHNYDATAMQTARWSKLFKEGQIAEGQWNESIARQAADQAVVVKARNDLQSAKLSLLLLMRMNTMDPEAFDISMSVAEEPRLLSETPQQVYETALSRMPEVKAAQMSTLSADYGVKIARSAYYPSLSANFSMGTGYSGAAKVISGNPDISSLPIGTVLGTGDTVYTFPQMDFSNASYVTKPFSSQWKDNINKSMFITLTVPIFNGFSIKNNAKKATLAKIQADLALEQTQQNLRQAVYQAYYDAVSARSQYESATEAERASEKSFRWTESRFNAGNANEAEYTASRTQWNNAQSSAIRAKYDFIFKQKILDFYQGGYIH